LCVSDAGCLCYKHPCPPMKPYLSHINIFMQKVIQDTIYSGYLIAKNESKGENVKTSDQPSQPTKSRIKVNCGWVKMAIYWIQSKTVQFIQEWTKNGKPTLTGVDDYIVMKTLSSCALIFCITSFINSYLENIQDYYKKIIDPSAKQPYNWFRNPNQLSNTTLFFSLYQAKRPVYLFIPRLKSILICNNPQ